ncbi:response regulator [Planctomicrobium piriforme]|uniref:Response regulatory domain-containing protein n=1 Tax=Planctomicrobium piriforme TaxID=1576369 RepID=A0A1I3RCT5_9PLAN|nr:hypothetical protein [Planctomicrobium piriforme]SFJ43016.1 hypothetical protein SAMN05421753_12057 [Planctomicrobium piriforme]
MLVALTGWGKEDDRKKSSDAGFDQHFVKPVELADLKKLLAAPAALAPLLHKTSTFRTQVSTCIGVHAARVTTDVNPTSVTSARE